MFLGIFRGLLFVKEAVLWGTVHLRYYPLYLLYISACVKKKSLHTVYSSVSFNRKYLFALCNGSENSTRSHLTCTFEDLQLPSDSSVCAICPNPISTLCDKALFSVFCDVLKVKSWRVPPPCSIWKKVCVGGVGGWGGAVNCWPGGFSTDHSMLILRIQNGAAKLESKHVTWYMNMLIILLTVFFF